MKPTKNAGRRGWGKATRCGRGHNLTLPDAVMHRDDGKRKCRECAVEWERERYQAAKKRREQNA